MTLTTPQALLFCATFAGCCFYIGKTMQENTIYNGIARVAVAKYEAQKAADDKVTATKNAMTTYLALESQRTNVEGWAKKAQLAEMRLQKACKLHRGKC